jgi:hypothetical protein
VKPAKGQVLDRPSVAGSWWGWWARHKLPHLTKRRVYVTDIDGLAWLPYLHEGRETVRILAILEVVPWGANLGTRRSSMAAIQALAARAGLPAFIVEVDHRRSMFRVRTMRGQHVLVGPADEARFARWIEGLAGSAEVQECSEEMPDWF